MLYLTMILLLGVKYETIHAKLGASKPQFVVDERQPAENAPFSKNFITAKNDANSQLLDSSCYVEDIFDQVTRGDFTCSDTIKLYMQQTFIPEKRSPGKGDLHAHFHMYSKFFENDCDDSHLYPIDDLRHKQSTGESTQQDPQFLPCDSYYIDRTGLPELPAIKSTEKYIYLKSDESLIAFDTIKKNGKTTFEKTKGHSTETLNISDYTLRLSSCGGVGCSHSSQSCTTCTLLGFD